MVSEITITYSHQIRLLKLMRMQTRPLKTISGGGTIKVTISQIQKTLQHLY